MSILGWHQHLRRTFDEREDRARRDAVQHVVGEAMKRQAQKARGFTLIEMLIDVSSLMQQGRTALRLLYSLRSPLRGWITFPYVLSH